jgi:hypothetical protein
MQSNEQSHTSRMRVLSAVSMLLGAWLVIAPIVLAIPAGPFAWSGALAGVLIVIFSVVRFLSRHTAALSWGSAVIGAWVVMSPWVFDYLTAGFRTWSYVLAGGVVAVIAILSLTSSAANHPWTPEGQTDRKPDKLLR